ETYLRLVGVEQLEYLTLVGFGVGIYLLARQQRSRRGLAGRVADQSREVADKKDDCVAEFLKRAQLANHDRVAEVYVGRGRVCAEFYAQGLSCLRTLLKLCAQVVLADYLDRALA